MAKWSGAMALNIEQVGLWLALFQYQAMIHDANIGYVS